MAQVLLLLPRSSAEVALEFTVRSWTLLMQQVLMCDLRKEAVPCTNQFW
jgi:hypothetical protein